MGFFLQKKETKVEDIYIMKYPFKFSLIIFSIGFLLLIFFKLKIKEPIFILIALIFILTFYYGYGGATGLPHRR